MDAPNVLEEGKKMEKYSYEEAVDNAKTHQVVSQYTDLCALKKIIGNKTLRLTRVDELNDLLENKNILDLWKGKVYVSCFTYRAHESLFFWNTYSKCKPCGVMISFQSKYLQDLEIYPDEKCQKAHLEECKQRIPEATFNENVSAEHWGIFDYSCVDVMYIPRDEIPQENEYFQGRIKYKEWDMECETRIRVTIRPKCKEVKSFCDVDHYYRPSDEYLYAKLPIECLEKMTITLSPFANDILQKEVENLLKDNNLFDKVKVIKSTLTEELKQNL